MKTGIIILLSLTIAAITASAGTVTDETMTDDHGNPIFDMYNNEVGHEKWTIEKMWSNLRKSEAENNVRIVDFGNFVSKRINGKLYHFARVHIFYKNAFGSESGPVTCGVVVRAWDAMIFLLQLADYSSALAGDLSVLHDDLTTK